MAVKSGFFNSDRGNMAFEAEFFAQYFSSLIANGVFPNPSNNLQVIAGTKMTTVVTAGKGWVNGYYVVNDGNFILKHDKADAMLKRIDYVVMRLNLLARKIEFVVKKGKLSKVPATPALTRNTDYHELLLASVYVGNGVTQLTQANITDTRLNTNLCGIVHAAVDQIDTTTLFTQMQSWFDQFKIDANSNLNQFSQSFQADLNAWINLQHQEFASFKTGFESTANTWMASKRQQFDNWFNNLSTEGEVATNLANRITEVDTQLAESNKDLSQRGTNLKSVGAKGDKKQDDTTYLQGLIDNIRKAPSVYASTTIDVPAGNYLVTSTITLPPYVRLRSNGIVKFSYTGTGALFHIFNDKNPQQDNLSQTATNVGDLFTGTFILQGLRTAGQIGLLIGEEVFNLVHVTHTAWMRFCNLYIEKFDKAIKFTQKQTYLTRFNNVTISHCNTIISDSGTTAENAGELITWTDCAFHNSDLFLSVSSEINHEFKGCSIDFNRKGVLFTGNKYSTQRFTDCWIEGNGNDTTPFITSDDSSISAYVIFNGNHIFFPNKKGNYLCTGNVAISFNDNEVTMNRYSNKVTHSLASSSVLFNDEVRVVNCNAPIFHENPIAISRKYFILNRNQDFELDGVGVSTITGFTTTGATVAITNVDSFLGSKCLKINSGGTNYVNVITEMIELNGSKLVFGQCNFKTLDSSLNFQTRLQFYAQDGVTLVSTETVTQNFQIPSSDVNKWYCLPSGFTASGNSFNANNYVVVPPTATKVKATLTIGDINNDVYIDNFVINGVS
ncbi:MAG: glycosyl hydrolase family 28-related protein [Solibacillus sp.]